MIENIIAVVQIVRTILRYPVGAEVGFAYEFATEYRMVTGYHFTCGDFYVLFSNGRMVHMNRLGELVVSITVEKEDVKCKRARK